MMDRASVALSRTAEQFVLGENQMLSTIDGESESQIACGSANPALRFFGDPGSFLVR